VSATIDGSVPVVRAVDPVVESCDPGPVGSVGNGWELSVMPELTMVRPMPGFAGLTRYVLVRLDGPGEGSDDGSGDGSGDGSDGGSGDGSDGGSDDGSGEGSGDGPDLAGAGGRDADDAPPGPIREAAMLYELRSLEDPQVRFLVAVPTAFFPDYGFDLSDSSCSDLELWDAAEALVLVVLTIGRDSASTTANLLAPVVINARTRSAVQVILSGSQWPVRATVA
jgi:flagellar assembly factor FliW